MTKREPYRNRIELVQGTLDMLILRTLQWGPQHGHGIGQALLQDPRMLYRSNTARSTRRCTGSKKRAGSLPNGSSPKQTAALSITGSLPRENGSFQRSSRTGQKRSGPLRASCVLLKES